MGAVTTHTKQRLANFGFPANKFLRNVARPSDETPRDDVIRDRSSRAILNPVRLESRSTNLGGGRWNLVTIQRSGSPPEGFWLHSADRVLEVIEDPGQVVAAVEDLERRGFDRGELFVFCGAGGADRKTEAAEILASHDAHDIEHFGRFHGEPLGSSPET